MGDEDPETLYGDRDPETIPPEEHKGLHQGEEMKVPELPKGAPIDSDVHIEPEEQEPEP